MSSTNSNTRAPITGVTGVGRDGHSSTSLLVYLDHNPGDAELRAIHDVLKHACSEVTGDGTGQALPPIDPPDSPGDATASRWWTPAKEQPWERMHAQLLDMLGAKTHEEAAASIGSLIGIERIANALGASRGCDLIAGERVRQIKGEGFSAERDRGYTAGELAQAAACYLGWEWTDAPDRDAFVAMEWPVGWNPEWFKPRDRCSDLVRAGALIAAEIDRLLAEQEPRA